MYLKTAGLFDAFSDQIRILNPVRRRFDGLPGFHGQAYTVKVFEDDTLVRAALETKGKQRVLVVDGGESLRCALIGDLLARLALENGWSGMVVYGCIRDSAVINRMNIRIRALNTHPAKSHKRGEGQKELCVQVAGVDIYPGDWIYADGDGIIVSKSRFDG